MNENHTKFSQGRPKWFRHIEEELEWYREHAIKPRQIVLGIDRYQELMAWLAGEEGLDFLEPRTEWKDCRLVVVKDLGFAEVGGDVNDLWENGEAFGVQPAEKTPAAAVDEWAL